jgi:serine/threonine protein kinase/tetratricopeptide (TPR) repeat protein
MAEFVSPAISLADRLRSRDLEIGEALLVARQIGDALRTAHEAARIHGSLTSSSILLRDDGSLRATVAGFDGELPTPPILENLAPERRAGQAPSIAGDVYSYGRILEETKNAVRYPGPISASWDMAIHRCLDRVPERRFSSILSAMQAIGLLESEATASLAPVEPTPHGPTVWREFQLLQRVGQGSFGEVYRAWDPILEREIALKFLFTQGLNPEQELSVAVSEARAIARVRHPNIVSVYGVDRRDGRVGFWSDFVRGRTLNQLVEAQGPLAPKEAAEIGIALCDALEAVHTAGLLHRDIKASNAMRDENGRVLLMDLGLSREVGRATDLAGTPQYMAPELMAGQPPSVQSDVYAMGILLLFLCTGEYPLRHGGEGALERVPELFSGLRQVIGKAVDRDPQQRYASAGRLRAALRTTLEPAAPSAVSAVPAHSSKRKRKWWIAAAVVILCAGGLLISAFLIPGIRRFMPLATSGANPAAYQDFQAAEDALLRYDKPGNTGKAIALYKKTLERSPNFALAAAGLARADWRMYLDTSDQRWADQASQASANAASMNSNLAPVQMALGTIHVEQGKFGLGVQELEQAKELDPRSADVRAALGEAYRQQNRLDAAKQELQTAIDLAPDDWRWPYLLAALEIDAGDFKSAEANLKTALEKTPDNARILYNLGIVYWKENRLSEAQTVLEQAIRLDPRTEPLMALGDVFVLQGKYDDAIQIYKRAVQRNPDDWNAWGNLAEAWQWSERDPREAVRDYHHAIELAQQQMKTTPDDLYLISYLGNFYSNLQDEKQALPFLRKSLVLAPKDPDVLERAAESYEALGRRQEALQLIDQALKLGFSVDYAKKVPALQALRRDPRAPQQIREPNNAR